ncbi:MAG: 30S ribosomal protein S8e [Nitrosopumilaceae archaeon]|nr:30S ribosomal protein S8e [Nitrosopumilaceae archaeon]
MKKSIENLSKRKLTGGKKHPLRTRRKYEIDRYPNEAQLGKQITIKRRARGNNIKNALKKIDYVNVSIGSKVKKLKIIKVLENKANNDYQRRGVITKGAILETENGKCRVISKPGQDGVVNAIKYSL